MGLNINPKLKKWIIFKHKSSTFMIKTELTWISSYLSQAWRRLHVKRHHMCQTTWIILRTLMSSKAQPLASDPAASQRTTSPVSSCQEHLNSLLHGPVSITQCQFHFVTSVADLVLCFSPQSTMRPWWRTCRYAKHSQCDFCIHKKNENLSACLVSRQTIPFSLCFVLILHFCVCSEVQDLWSTNEAVPQRKPP